MAGRVRKSMADGSGKQLHANAITSVLKKYERNEDKSNNFSKGMSFVRVVNRDSLKQLEIPNDFSVHFKGCLPHRLIIESRILKKCWRVEVEEDGNSGIFLGEGWSNFVEAHSFVVGEILMFVYSEPSIFQVKIYGRNGCEKTTLDEANNTGHQNLEKTGTFEDIKKTKRRDNGMKKNADGHGIHKKQSAAGRRLKWTQERTSKVFISENSVAFSVVLNKQKDHQFSRMAVPKAVAVAKRLQSKKRVTLQNVQGKCWQVSLIQRKDGRPLLCKGWKDFLKVNNMVGGDALHFQFLSDSVIQVHATKTSEVGHQSEEVKHQDESSRSLNMQSDNDDDDDHHGGGGDYDDDRTTSKSSSSFTWRKTTRCGGVYLYIPRAIAESRKLMNRGSVVLRDPEGKCWPVEIRTWPSLSGRVALSKGWCQFWQAHDIEAGDTVNFEFLSDNFVQVDIVRGKSLEPAGEGGGDKPAATDYEATAMESEDMKS